VPHSGEEKAVDRIETRIGAVAYRRAGAGDPLVLLHGGLSDGRSWAPQMKSLATDYDLIAWDAPGCGASADPAGHPDLDDYADAVAALIDALGVGPVHLAGHSFGAGLAIDVCARHPGLVRSLVLSGASAGRRGRGSARPGSRRPRPAARLLGGPLPGRLLRPLGLARDA
jgi:pimeloyl-ACP methyl ester carboxylesterase